MDENSDREEKDERKSKERKYCRLLSFIDDDPRDCVWMLVKTKAPQCKKVLFYKSLLNFEQIYTRRETARQNDEKRFR